MKGKSSHERHGRTQEETEAGCLRRLWDARQKKITKNQNVRKVCNVVEGNPVTKAWKPKPTWHSKVDLIIQACHEYLSSSDSAHHGALDAATALAHKVPGKGDT